jgi:hypothetical protein
MVMGNGSKLARPPHSPTPCYQCPKVPAETREEARRDGWTPTSKDAIEPDLWHYAVVRRVAECHAVGRFPESPWLERWASLVRPVILAAEQRPMNNLVAVLATIVKR